MTAAPSESSRAASELVSQCLAQWDSGGRQLLYEAFDASLKSQASGISTSSIPFIHLWKALLLSHISSPLLNPGAFVSLFKTIYPSQNSQDNFEVGRSSEDLASDAGAGPSRHSTPSGQTIPPSTPDVCSQFENQVLDVIWAVDVEIDLRREVADAGGYGSLSFIADSDNAEASKGRAKRRETPSDEAKASKSILAELVRDLLTSNCLSRVAVAERLEVSLLSAIGLITDEAAFNKKGVRINTANLYKQQKFNLLREENEGYSGLMNELLGGMGPDLIGLYDVPFDKPHDWYTAPARIVEQETAEQRNRRARAVMRNISALIGYFDLDPNRVLDIILDCFASNVNLHWPFFLSLMAVSPWAGDKKRHIKTITDDDAMDLDANGLPSIFSAAHLEGDTVDLDTGGGNSTCAQLLGFKFDYYRLPETREEVPPELYTMSALLIKDGSIRFADLWHHLSPSQEGMKALQGEYNTALKDKAAAARSNALSMAAPLADEDSAGGPGEANEKEQPADGPSKGLSNQILGILKALLSVGELRHAHFILGLYPWLMGSFADVPILYTRLLKVVVAPLYKPISSSTAHDALGEEFLNGTKMRFNVQRQALFPAPPPRLVPTPLAIEPVSTAVSRFIFAFGTDWTHKLPRCRSAEDIDNILVPLLRLLGVHLHCDFSLFQQICRIGKAQLQMLQDVQDLTDGQRRVEATWLDIIRSHLFPALSLTSGNSGLLHELWSLLRILPYTKRFTLYGEWKNEVYKHPEVRYRQMETEKEAKGILKRISKDNLKVSGRALAKASHANPLIFFTIALNQVQVYDNMIPHIVECAKYLTPLEYDVFSFNLIDALSNPEKERTKQDGTNISLWLKSLASFTGTLYRRYTSMDPVPVLHYIANQLKANNSKDLVIIRELILKMSGIEPLANLSDKQIAALSGGRFLRIEAMMAANAGPGTSARQQNRRTGTRLMDSLKESHLAVALLVLIAQQRQVCVHLVPEQEAHLRYLGNLADSCQEVLFQYVEFLHSQVEPAAYAELIPSLKALCVRFDIEPAIAFHIARPRLLYAMKQADDAEAERKLRAELLASKAKISSPVIAVKSETDDQAASDDVSGKASIEPKTEDADGDTDSKAETIWRAGLQEAIDAANSILTEEVKGVLSPQYYATFWQLSLADIQVPTERYEQEMRVYQQLMKETDPGEGNKKPAVYLRHQESLEQLRAELKARTLAHQATRRRLVLEKDHWFPHNDGTTRPLLVQHLLQFCLIPRALLSPTDAMFAGKFIRLMHLNGTRNFSSLTLYDRIFIEHVAPVVFSCTENEANSYARFLQVVLDDLTPWYKSQQLFDKEVIGTNLPGFQMRWGSRRGGEQIPQEALFTYEQFRNVLRKWHGHMRIAFKLCLSSTDFMRIRNAIVVMTRISHHFPLFEQDGQDLIQVVEKLTSEETRGSLKVLGQGLLATLKKRQSDWVGSKAVTKASNQPTGGQATKSAPVDKVVEGDSKVAGAQPLPHENGKEDSIPTTAPTKANEGQPEPPTRTAEIPQGPRNSPPSGPAADRHRAGSTSDAAHPSLPSGPAASHRRAIDSQQQQKANLPNARGYRTEAAAIPVRPLNGRAPASSSPLPARPSASGRDSERLREQHQNSDRKQEEDRVRSSANDQSRKGPSVQQSQKEVVQASASLPTGPRNGGTRGELREPSSTSSESASVSAARQAALDSMNPPASPATTSAAQAVRERAVPPTTERDRNVSINVKAASRSSSPSRAREGETTTRSSVSSRDPSPRSGWTEADGAGGRSRDGRRDREDRDRDYHKDRRDREARDARDTMRDSRDSRDTRDRGRDRDDRRRPEETRRVGNDRYGPSSDRDRMRDRGGREDRRDEGQSRSGRGGGREDASGETSRSEAPQGPREPATLLNPSIEDATAAAYKRRRIDREEATTTTSTASASDSGFQDKRDDRSRDRGSDNRDLPSGPSRRGDRLAMPGLSTARGDLLDHPSRRSNSLNTDAGPSSRDDVSRGGMDANRSRRSTGALTPNEATDGSNSPSGLKRSLADRLSGQDKMALPASPVNERMAPDGPDQKRPRVSRNRFSDLGASNDRGSAPGSPAPAAIDSGNRAAHDVTGSNPPVRSVSITGSAARERERREGQRADLRDMPAANATPTGPSSSGRGGRGAAHGDERDGYSRRRVREEGRYKDRSRRRAGED